MWLRKLLRFAFRLLYNELAWTYDVVSWMVSAGQWRAWQRAALPRLRGRRVLEVAHGTGDMLLDLRALGFEPVGLDLSPAMSRLARRKLRRHGLGGELARGRAQALPFADASFTSLLATFPTEFMLDPAAVAEFHRVLQPGGLAVLVPAAQITGPSLPDRGARWLFAVTGQSAQGWFSDVLSVYHQAGFAARAEQVRLPRSRVTLIVAEKAA